MSRSFTRTVRAWTNTLRAPLNRTPVARRPIVRLRLQDLEDRTTPATFLVTNNLDDGSVGSLRWAILQANAVNTNDDIDFDAAFFSTPKTINLTSALPQFSFSAGNATVTGPGSANLTVDGGDTFRVFDSAAPLLTMSGMTVANGLAALSNGGGLLASNEVHLDRMVFTGNAATGNAFGEGSGAAIALNAFGNLLMRNSTVSGNTAQRDGAGIYFYYSGLLVLENSTISGNTTTDTINAYGWYSVGGAGIYFYGGASYSGPPSFTPGTLVIRNSTIANNTTAGSGGGINTEFFFGKFLIENSTITGNVANTPDGGFYDYGGGGIFQYSGSAGVTVTNTIVSGNSISGSTALGPDIRSRVSAEVNFSAIGDTGGFAYTGGNNLIGQALLLGPLQPNGGATETIAPGSGSPLIDAGGDHLLPPGMGTDQRGIGFYRIYANAVDIGAVEDQPISDGPFVLADVTNIFASGGTDYFFTVTYYDPAGTTIGIDVSTIIDNDNAVLVTGPNGFTQFAEYVSIDVATDGTPRKATYKITAPGGTWDGIDTGFYQVEMQSGQVADLDGDFAPQVKIGKFAAIISPIVVTNNNDAGPGSLRDAMTLANLSPNDEEIVFDPTFFNTPRTINLTSPLPVIPATAGNLKITGPGVANLKVDAGGQFRVFDSTAPELTLAHFEVTGGLATQSIGGGLRASGFVTIDHMLFTNNTATRVGGSYFNYGGGGAIAMVIGNQFLLVKDSTISGNSADMNGGGIMFRYGGTLQLENSTVSGNQTTTQVTFYDGYGNPIDVTGYFGGAGIFLAGTASTYVPPGFTAGASVIVNSTITENTAAGSGGAIFGNGLGGNVFIQDSTITGNTSSGGAQYGPLYGYQTGGGGIGWVFASYYGDPAFKLTNTIVSGNSSLYGNDIQSLSSVSADFSAIGDVTGFPLSGGNNIGPGTDLMLGPLQDNGGPTKTIAPLAGSPLIDAGSDDLIPGNVISDQRGIGFYRSFANAVDIGALEDQPITEGPFVFGTTTNVFNSGGTDYFFTVTYTDPNGTNNGIDVSTIIGNNNAVLVTGPNGFSQFAQYVSIDDNTNGMPRTATYMITAPGGVWDGTDTGYYKVQMQADQVLDLDGNAAPQVNVGRFVAVISPLIVTNTNDTGPGSLRDAIALANLSPNDDEIVFDPIVFGTQQTISVESPLPQFAATAGGLTITGPGASLLTVERSAGATADFRVFDSFAPSLKLSGFTVSGGTEFGGGLAAWTGGTIDHMVFTGNNSTSFGGAIYVGFGQTMTISDTVVSGNSSNSSWGGGGIIVDTFGVLNLQDSTVTGNSATAAGGGIFGFYAPVINIQNSTISDNTAGVNGGGVYFYSGGTLLLENSTISGNTTTYTGTYDGYRGGGGLYFYGFAGSLLISNSTIANNTTSGTGGGIMLQVFYGNIDIVNSTISGNTSLKTGSSSYGYPYGGGGIGHTVGYGTVTLANTIVSGNTNTGGAPDISKLYGTYANYSAIGDTTGFTYLGANNLIGQALMLTPLQDNGGPTLTFALLPGSPLLDVGSNALVTATTDQRGGDRIFNGTVDIGSVELQPPKVTIDQADDQADPTKVGPIVFDVQFTTAVTGFDETDIDFTGSTLGGLTATVTPLSPSKYTLTVTGMAGEGTVVASIPADAATDPVTSLNSLASTSTDNSVTFDEVSPTVTIDEASGQVDPTNVTPVNFEVVFSEPVIGFDGADIDFTGSTIAGLTATVIPTIDPTIYTVSVLPPASSQGKIVINIPAGSYTDLALNDGLAASVIDNSVDFDNIVPTVTINQSGTTDPTGGSSVTFDVVFSEPVIGFDETDIDLTGTTAPGATVSVSGTGPAYTVTVSGMTAGGLIVASIPGGAVTDAVGNPNDPSTSTDNSITFIHSGTVQLTQAVYSTSERSSPTVTVTVTRTVEAGTTAEGALSVDLVIGGGTASAGVDYTGTGATISWADGESGPKTFVIQINDDQFLEGLESANVSLNNISVPGALGTPSSATLEISDYEEGTLSFDSVVYNAAESDGGDPFAGLPATATITVTRTGGSDGEVRVDFSSAALTALAGSDYTAPLDQVLIWGHGDTLSKTITIPILEDLGNEGRERISLSLTNARTEPPLGAGETFNPIVNIGSATVIIAPSDGAILKALSKQNVVTLTDTDGDLVTVTLGGGTPKLAPSPTARVYITDPDGDGKGPIELITLKDTVQTRSTLQVKVKKPKGVVGNDGRVGLGAIEEAPGVAGTTGLKSITAAAADLDGDGIHLDGYINSVNLGNVKNGADIVTTGGTATQKQKTSIRLLTVDNGTDISVANPISTLRATSFGDGSITAPYASVIQTTGRKANAKKNDLGDPGHFNSDLALSGLGVLANKSTLAQLKVKGNIIGSDISVNGKIATVSSNAFIGSRLFVGFNGTDTGIGTYNPTGTLNSFSTRALLDSFQDSLVIANAIKSASLRSVDADNSGEKIGFIAHTKIGQVTSRLEKFKYTAKMGNFKNIPPDFEVRANVPGFSPPLASQSAVAVREVAASRASIAPTTAPIVAGPLTTATAAATPRPRLAGAASAAAVRGPALPPRAQGTGKSLRTPDTQPGVSIVQTLRKLPQSLLGMVSTPTAPRTDGQLRSPNSHTRFVDRSQNGQNGSAAAAFATTPSTDDVATTTGSEVTTTQVVSTTTKPQATSNPAVVKLTTPAPLVSALPLVLGGKPLGGSGVTSTGNVRGTATGRSADRFRVNSNFLGQQATAAGTGVQVSALPLHLAGGTAADSDGLELA